MGLMCGDGSTAALESLWRSPPTQQTNNPSLAPAQVAKPPLTRWWSFLTLISYLS